MAERPAAFSRRTPSTQGPGYGAVMFNRTPPDHCEDPSVAEVEAILERRTDGELVPTRRERPLRVESLFWICACVTVDDAPIWPIYGAPEGAVQWCRLTGDAHIPDYIDAQATAGGHADPAAVLNWLRSTADEPWGVGGSGWGDDAVLTWLGDRLRVQAP